MDLVKAIPPMLEYKPKGPYHEKNPTSTKLLPPPMSRDLDRLSEVIDRLRKKQSELKHTNLKQSNLDKYFKTMTLPNSITKTSGY